MSIPKTFAEFKKIADARRALFWRLVGQAATAFPDDFAEIEARAHIIARDFGWDEGRELASIVEECAKRWPNLAFTHA